ncbi:hypothetical protein [Blastococcus xanthinilyticus]|uniref:CVNH domain-containing protein n=1 Tax=Blastococcus xanthinilyticus TaxID=1564164 RepID=A0A5S5CZR2_9ACTN|nr:hypothetical protein [Blastococcus xanthinilyticus]TYP87869.1 hypothetical protein BD833_10540 [Blastococcus xanthinilyticus]
MPSTTRAPRLAAGLLAGGLALAALSGCSFTSENVSCASGTCTVTLSGAGAEAEILGTTLSFDGVQDGRASLSVGGTSVSCGEGESVAAGPLQLSCSGVSDDSVELTATLG